MHLTTLTRTFAASLLLGALVACGGGYTPPSAPAAAPGPTAAAMALAYTDPTGSGWRLVKDSSSTTTQLVLNLVGPTGEKARGVGFNLRAGGPVAFHLFHDVTTAPGTYVKDQFVRDTGVFQLKYKTSRYDTDLNWMYEPILLAGGVKEGGRLLTVGLYQKDRTHDAQPVDGPKGVLQIGIDLPSSGGPRAGETIPLTLVRARTIPGFIGNYPTDPNNVDWTSVLQNFRMDDIQIAVGTLHAQ
ncbi:MAG TPA: hypothetical protein VJ570_00645 [Holophagaceae bacterium]|nr:hypothetical protein [Holophagaceae bacterium]